MFRGGDKAVLDTTESAERLLVCTRVEEADILGAFAKFRQKDSVRVTLLRAADGLPGHWAD